MNKEKEIEKELADIIAEFMFKNGYRKADEVRKETAKEILFRLKKAIVGKLQTDYEIIDNLLWEYGVEVDE